MYTPDHFAMEETEQPYALMRRYPFATLISGSGLELSVSHLPLLVDRRADGSAALLGHMAIGNPHWRALEGAVVTAVFQGPHGYISPSWYDEARAVPTWNYAAVHATGVARLIREVEPLMGMLERLVQVHEAGCERPWLLDPTDPWTRQLTAAIVGFEIPIASVQGKLKLSQNRTPGSQRGVVDALSGSADAGDQALAALMAEVLGLGQDGQR